MTARFTPMIAATLALAAPLGGCSKASGDASAKVDAHGTLAAAIGGAPGLTTVSNALSQSGLADVFDGPGSYTVLAPDDSAFARLGPQAKALTGPEHRAEMVALLRGHILPGHLTPEAIRKAIAAKKGPVKITTLGDGDVTFSDDHGKLAVTGPDGSKATVDGKALVASNGVVLPLDGLVKKAAPTPAR
jgi:uncharacterized surface protein with fasciclin (FAS1) repeats